MKIGFIYKITSPSGKIYIGKTADVKYRLSKYKCLDCKAQIKLYHSFKKYGYENHVVEILAEMPYDELAKSEVGYIKKFNSFKKGLNCTLGGEGVLGRKADIFQREAARQRMLGTKQSEEQKRRRSLAMAGNKYALGSKPTQEVIRKRAENRIGKKMPPKSEETIRRMSAAQIGKTSPRKGKKVSEVVLSNLRASYARRKKPVAQIGGQGNVLMLFCSVDAAANHFHINKFEIYDCCRRARPSSLGYKFKYYQK